MPVYGVTPPDNRALDILDGKIASLAQRQNDLLMRIGRNVLDKRDSSGLVDSYQTNKIIMDAFKEVRSAIQSDHTNSSW